MLLFEGYYPRSSSYAIACSDEEGRIFKGYYPRSSSYAIACVDDEGRIFDNYYPRSSSYAIACVDDEGRLFDNYYPRSSSYAIACIDEGGRIFDSYYPRSSSYAVACADRVSNRREKYAALAAYYVLMKRGSANIGSSNSSTGCFLTTACVQARNLPDDCEELTVLRHYRDHWLVNQPSGREDIALYYKIAPGIVKRLDEDKDSKTLYENIYTNVIVPCVNMIKEGKNNEAYVLYKNTMLEFMKNIRKENK